MLGYFSPIEFEKKVGQNQLGVHETGSSSGDTNVSSGIFAGVLRALRLLDGLGRVTDISNDSVGQALAGADRPS